jgi:hypothetical protein
VPLHLARSVVPLAAALALMSGCLLPASAASAADRGASAAQAAAAGGVITGPDYSHSGVSPGNLFWGQEGTAVGGPGAGNPGLGTAATSVLRDAAIGAGLLIVTLAALLVLAQSRRRRARAARERELARASRTATGRGPAGQRRPHRLALPPGPSTAGAGAPGQWTADSWAAGSPAPGSSPGILPAGPARPRPRSSQIARTGNLGQMGLPAARPSRPYDTPPWAPARRPADATPVLPAPIQAAPIQAADPGGGLPPWDQGPGSPGQDPDAGGFPPARHTGPMYVWNPATNSGPFPAADGD